MTRDRFDEIFTIVGNAGRFQLFVYCTLSFTAIYAGLTSVASVFLLATVDYHCQVGNETVLPEEFDSTCNTTSISKCEQFQNGSYTGDRPLIEPLHSLNPFIQRLN